MIDLRIYNIGRSLCDVYELVNKLWGIYLSASFLSYCNESYTYCKYKDSQYLYAICI